MNPNYPVYVISKGRWDSRLTVRALESLGVPFRVIVEPQEYENYAAVIAPANILVLPFSNLGQGSIPARNWVWEDSKSKGFERHWILDDNIRSFYRMNNRTRIRVKDGTIFNVVESFSDRYENVALSGLNYLMFGVTHMTSKGNPPMILNTRIYSCILINNAIPFRWRGRYNEDTDLSLCALKAGWCTALFNAFLCDKITTMKMTGGNTDELYKQNQEFDGRLEMAKSLQAQHPDVVKISRKWNRWQHQVNYKPFKNNRFRPKAGVEIPQGVNDYGMVLRKKPS